MDSFSVASLTSLCETISHAAVSTNTELSDLLRATGDRHAQQSFTSLYGALQRFGEQLNQLEASLARASVLSESLRTQLNESLSVCQRTMGSLSKQVMRVDESLIGSLNHVFLETLVEVFDSYCHLLQFYNNALHINSREDQDAALRSSDGTSVSSKVKTALTSASKAGEILINGGNDVPAYDSPSAGSSKLDGELPPPYDGPSPGPAPREEETSSGGFDMSSLKHSWKALTSGLSWFKPDPLVSALCEASRRGDVNQIAGLLKQGANINGKNEDSRTPLACAVVTNQAQAARLLLASGADEKSSMKTPALFEAAAAGSLDVAEVLIKRGAKATQQSASGQPYFYDVVNNDASSLDGIQYLLHHGATVNMTSLPGRLPIVCAVRKNRLDLLKLLLEHGATANSKDYTGSTILSLAIDHDPDSEMVDLLLSRGAPADSKTISGQSVLAVAVSKRSVNLTRKLLERGANGSAKDISGSPLLINVIKDSRLSDEEKTEFARLLLTHGANPKVKDISGTSVALHIAMSKAPGEVVGLLLQHGADASGTMSNGESLVSQAIQSNRQDQLEALLKNKASPNISSTKGKSPLMMALIKQDLSLIKLLRQYGAEINMDEKEMASALGRADIRAALGLEAASPSSSGPSRAPVVARSEAPPSYNASGGDKNW